MMSFMGPFILMALFFGGEDSLSGYVNPEQYWESRGIEYEVETLSSLLAENKAVDEASIQKWIAQLAADAFSDREAASRALAEIGQPAQTQLKTAAQSRDPEVAQRAQILLKEIQTELGEEGALDEWMALYSLSRMKDPAAEAVLQNIRKGPEGELKTKLNSLGGAPSVPPADATAVSTAAGFPADTRLLVQMKPHKGNQEVLKAIHQSAAVQKKLVELLTLTGDIKVHQLTFGLNEGVFLKENGRLLVRAEMDYDTEKMCAMLEKGKFQKIADGEGAFVYRASHLTVALGDNRHFVAVIPFDRGQNIEAPQILSVLKGSEPDQIPDSLGKLFGELPASSMVRGAGEFSEGMMANLKDISALRQFRFHAQPGENALEMALVMSTTGTQSATALGEVLIEENRKILELLGHENEEWVKPMMNTLETLKFSNEESQVLIEGEITPNVLLGTVRMLEQMMRQQIEIQQRHQQHIQQQQIRRQQILMNREMEFVF